jgi:hypothetical protein
MEEYHAYVQECIRTGIVPITISVYLRPRILLSLIQSNSDDEEEPEDEDPEEPEVESEEAEDP